MSWGRNQLPASMGVPRNADSGQSTDVGAAWALVTEDISADASLKIFSNVEQIVPSINTSLVLPDPAHLQLNQLPGLFHRPSLQGSCRPAFYCWRKETSLFLLVTVRSHRSGTSVLGECRASQLSASCLFFKDITRGLSFSQVCVRKSPSAARPGCCLHHGSKYSLLPAWDTAGSQQCSAEERGSMAVPCGTALCSQQSTVLPAEQCQHCTVSRAGTLPSPGRAGPAAGFSHSELQHSAPDVSSAQHSVFKDLHQNFIWGGRNSARAVANSSIDKEFCLKSRQRAGLGLGNKKPHLCVTILGPGPWCHY